MADYGIFRTNDAKRIAAATRRVEGTPRAYLRVPEQISRRYGGTSTSAPDNGFPDGVECDCGHCIAGVTLPSATECCEGHPHFTMTNPISGASEEELDFFYAGSDDWISTPFTIPDNDDVFVFYIEADVDGRTIMRLVVETDNSGDDVCLEYGMDGFQCNCDNKFILAKPYGLFEGINRSRLSCYACLKPVAPSGDLGGFECTNCFASDITFLVESDGWVQGTGPFACGDYACELFNATFVLRSSGTCRWKNDEIKTNPDLDDDPLTGNRCNSWFSSDDTTCDRVFHAEMSATGGGGGGFFGGDECNLILNIYQGGTRITSDGIGGTSLTCGTHSPVAAYSGSVSFPYDGSDITLTAMAHAEDFCDGPDTLTLKAPGAPISPTSSGACVDVDCTSTAAPANPLGYCCYQNACYDYIDQTICEDIGGEWNAGVDCSPGDCFADVCCMPDGTCAAIGYAACLAVSGTPAASCDECNVACCRSNGTCNEVPASDCVGADEFSWGPGTTCAEIPGCNSCCVSTVGGGSEDCSSDDDCECTYVGSEAECFALSGSDNSKAFDTAPCAARFCECAAGSETCDNVPA